MSFQVFRVQRWANTHNTHGIDRSEEWVIKKDEGFLSEEAAKEYIKERHRSNHIFITLTELLTPREKENFLEVFSFDPRYSLSQTHFLAENKGQVQAILSRACREAGISIQP